MGCCSVDAEPEAPTQLKDCPSCGQRGRRVKPITLDSLLLPGTERRDASYRFCATVGCEVAWFGEASGHRLAVSSSSVAIGQKLTSPDRTLCYCFGHTAADVADEIARTGACTIPDRIAERCRAGDDRCPETNPQGACCLGNVRAMLE